ncbi:hypothetical protein IAQ61_005966 [Plenodomus lingam]|uniref:uncharacterized protein n=1 Tax=Leptosphaeria maculans TaxID=5022 RepID=UPI0033175229|nr:hypothetical protein IAQ61_005966 [Plenodomus lingam]
MASLDFDQKFLGRIAKQTAESNPFLSDALYQILGLSVLLARRLIRARKLRKLDPTRDTPSLSAYQHILWMSREGLSILELYVLPYAQDNQHGPECRVLSVKLRASFYHIFCLFHNQPPVTAANLGSTDPRLPGGPPLPNSPRRKNDPGLSPSSKRAGKQPTLREPINSMVSESSFVTNPYAGAGGPVGTPSPGPTINAPPGLNPIPIPQPSSFILPPLNFVPLAGGYFTTATSYATSYLPGSHPLRLSVALEHSAFLWDCLHDHDGSRRIARRAIKDVYRAQEAMDDTEFEDAAELVSILGRMMKRKSWEGTPRLGGMGSPEPQGPPQTSGGATEQASRTAFPPPQHSPQASRRAAEAPPSIDTSAQIQARGTTRSRGTSASTSAPRAKEGGSHEITPRVETQRHARVGSQGTTPPRARHTRHTSMESGASTTPRAPPVGGRSPATPSTVRSTYQPPGSSPSYKGTPQLGSATPFSMSAAATLVSEQARYSPGLRRSPPAWPSPSQETPRSHQQR